MVSTGYSDTNICLIFGGNSGHRIDIYPRCNRTMDPDLGLGRNSGQDLTTTFSYVLFFTAIESPFSHSSTVLSISQSCTPSSSSLHHTFVHHSGPMSGTWWSFFQPPRTSWSIIFKINKKYLGKWLICLQHFLDCKLQSYNCSNRWIFCYHAFQLRLLL